ncbi:MAG: 2-dehydropantoate 2-reductase [Candidatus Omnitrophica bacterium]|nr:2-dehydropantoate 2-reductase [Candidatus Omnitrophota bacterium]
MKIVIVGPGAMGLLLYVVLTKTRHELWLLDKDRDRAARLKKDGVRIEGHLNARFQDVRVTADPAECRDADFWFVCVKSYDTKTVIRSIAPQAGTQGFIVSFQNGAGNIELLTDAFGAQRVILAVTNLGATLLTEGVSRYTGEGDVILGRVDGALGVEMKVLRELFQKAKLAVKLSRDINGVLWSKLVINAGINAVAAVTRLKNGRIMCCEGSRRVAEAAITEAHKVAKRKRIKLLYDDVLAKAESVCEATSENVSSMLADVLRRKPTEIDAINGAIVRHAQSLGVKTPVNAFLVDLVKTIESSYADEIIRS